MTDEQMDARLLAAGAAWRDAVDVEHPQLAELSTEEPTGAASYRGIRRRRGAALATAALIAAVLAVGGTLVIRSLTGERAPAAGTTDPGLRGTVWVITGYDGQRPDLASSATLFIGMYGTKLVADDACTVVGAQVGTSPSVLGVSGRVVRHRQCTDTAGVQLSSGLPILDGRATYRLSGRSLQISRAGHTMHLVAAPFGTPQPTLDVPTVVGANWRVVRVVDAARRSVPLRPGGSLSIDDHGGFRSYNGCNGTSGRVRVAVPVAVFKPGVATAVMCSGATARSTVVEDAVLAGSTRATVAGGLLTISKARVGAVIYRWVPADAAATDPALLPGRTWRLELAAGRRAAASATLRFGGDGTVNGTDGCTSFRQPVEVQHGTFALQDFPGISSPGCSAAARAQATTVDRFLSSPEVLWTVRDGRLNVTRGGAQADALVYSEGFAATLAGRRWVASSSASTGGSGADKSSGSFWTGAIVLTFDTHGGWHLTGSCEDETGSVTMTASALRFSVLRTTRTDRCARLSAQQRRLVQQFNEPIRRVLEGTASWTVSESHLELSRAGAEVTFTG